MKNILLFILLCCIISCTLRINQNFDYNKIITPSEIQLDIEDLKSNLINKHVNIDWEGKREKIFTELDSIKHIKSPIAVDSFERRLLPIINSIDDGHSRLIHQDSIKKGAKINSFSTIQIEDSIFYLKILHFMDSKNLDTVLKKLTNRKYNSHDKIIIDIRYNPGGDIRNVLKVLSCFLPVKTKIFETIVGNRSTKYKTLMDKIKSSKYINPIKKYTGKKLINGSPQIYVWINEYIASGSMLLSYHLQNNGAIIIGQAPKGVLNTFGNAYGYQLSKSKIIYTLATKRVLLSSDTPTRMEDMLKPDFLPETNWKLDDLVSHIIINKYR